MQTASTFQRIHDIITVKQPTHAQNTLLDMPKAKFDLLRESGGAYNHGTEYAPDSTPHPVLHTLAGLQGRYSVLHKYRAIERATAMLVKQNNAVSRCGQ